MHNFKPILRCIIFVFLCILINAAIKFALMPPSYTRVILNELNNSDTSYDCVILGASHGRSGINPYEIDKKLQVNSINMCIPSESIEDSYYLLKESCRKNTPKTVILDLDYQYWYNLIRSDYGATFIYDQLSLSPIKSEYIIRNLLDKDFRVFLTRWSNYTYLSSNIKSNLKTKLSKAYAEYDINTVNNKDAGGEYVGKGYFNRNRTEHDGKGSVSKIKWNSAGVDSTVKTYFNQIVDYCKDNNIKLVCVTSPITPGTLISGQYNQVNEYFTQLCSGLNVEFYDFNLVKSNVLSVSNTDFVDYDGHMCGEFATKYSSVLAQVITDAQDGNIDKNNYFYSSYKDYCDNLNTVSLVDMNLIPDVIDDENYSLSFNILGKGGTNIVPEYKVIIKNSSIGEEIVHSDYSDQTNYYYELKSGYYDVIIYSRNKGSSVDYDEYCKKSIDLSKMAIESYNKKHSK